MTTLMILYVMLGNGESGTVPMDAGLCALIPAAILAGEAVTVDTMTGDKIPILRAACLGPVDADPCELGASS